MYRNQPSFIEMQECFGIYHQCIECNDDWSAEAMLEFSEYTDSMNFLYTEYKRMVPIPSIPVSGLATPDAFSTNLV